MRGILKSVGVAALSVFLTQQVIPVFKIANTSSFVILAGLIFLANFIIPPLTKILYFLPNNFFVFNLAQIGAIFVVLFLLTRSFPEFQIGEFNFSGGTSFGISIAPFSLTALQATLVAAFLISAISNFLSWLAD